MAWLILLPFAACKTPNALKPLLSSTLAGTLVPPVMAWLILLPFAAWKTPNALKPLLSSTLAGTLVPPVMAWLILLPFAACKTPNALKPLLDTGRHPVSLNPKPTSHGLISHGFHLDNDRRARMELQFGWNWVRERGFSGMPQPCMTLAICVQCSRSWLPAS